MSEKRERIRRRPSLQLHVLLPGKLRKSLDRAARERGMKISEMVRAALRNYLEVP